MNDQQNVAHDESKFITKDQLMKWLNISNSQRRSFHDKGLPFIKVGTATFYYLPSVCAWMQGQEQRRSV